MIFSESEAYFYKKTIAFLLVLTSLILCLSACGTEQTGSGKLSIVATIFPEYDWVMQILGDRAENASVTLLLDSGVDLHSFQSTAKDIVTISNCSLFIYVGGESDSWVRDALAGPGNKDRIVIDLLEVLGDSVREEELVEGMEAGEDCEDEETEYDEHVWLSLRCSARLCEAIRDALIRLDPDGSDVYTANTAAYLEKLTGLDLQYRQAVDSARVNTLLFGDRFPFRYLTDDYDLHYYAAFAGCSAESEASFETVVFLADKLQELGLGAVMTLEGSDGKIARTIIDTAQLPDTQILAMDSMQSCTMKDIQAGASYLSIMEKNLEVLKTALNPGGN